MFRNFVNKLALAMVTGLVALSSNVQADDGCGCGATTDAFVADSGCGGCGNGGNFISKLRSHVNCDPSMRTNLWDGYCQERTACDSTNSCSGGGLLSGCGVGRHASGCGGCGSILFSGHGRSGCGLSGGCGGSVGCGGSCFAPAAASSGCGHIFGANSCFRSDGHFFGNFRRHHCGSHSAADSVYVESSCGGGCDAPAPSCGGCGGCNLFQHHRTRGGFLSRFKGIFQRGGSCGCGHFGGDCGSSMDYSCDSGCSQAVPACGCDG